MRPYFGPVAAKPFTTPQLDAQKTAARTAEEAVKARAAADRKRYKLNP